MAKTAEQIAAQLRDTLATQGFFPMLDVVADHVETMKMIHAPAVPLDGDVTSDQLRALYKFEMDMHEKVTPNGFKVDGPITASGNVIAADVTMTGELADGTSFRNHSLIEWTVEDGHIVACHAKADPDADEGREAFMKAVMESGIQIPAALN